MFITSKEMQNLIRTEAVITLLFKNHLFFSVSFQNQYSWPPFSLELFSFKKTFLHQLHHLHCIAPPHLALDDSQSCKGVKLYLTSYQEGVRRHT